MGQEGYLTYPKTSHRTASWAPRGGLLGKYALFVSDVQPWDRPLPSRQVVLWANTVVWSGLLMDLERIMGSRTRLLETASLYHFLTAVSAWQSNPPHPTQEGVVARIAQDTWAPCSPVISQWRWPVRVIIWSLLASWI